MTNEERRRMWSQITTRMTSIIKDHHDQTGDDIDVDVINEFMDNLGEEMKYLFDVE